MKNLPYISISVAMPNYNNAKYIGEAIESILNQSFKDFELIIYDDASTDNSVEIIRDFAKQDNRIVFLQGQVNKGESHARNTILDAARGKYIALLDSDDIALPERLETQYRYMEDHPHITVSGGSGRLMGNDSGLHSFSTEDKNIKAQMIFFCCFLNPTTMIRRDFLARTSIHYNTELKIGPDYHFWIQVITQEEYPVQFANLPFPLIYYRIHETNMSNKKDIPSKAVFNHQLFWSKYLKLDLNPREQFCHWILRNIEKLFKNDQDLENISNDFLQLKKKLMAATRSVEWLDHGSFKKALNEGIYKVVLILIYKNPMAALRILKDFKILLDIKFYFYTPMITTKKIINRTNKVLEILNLHPFRKSISQNLS